MTLRKGKKSYILFLATLLRIIENLELGWNRGVRPSLRPPKRGR